VIENQLCAASKLVSLLCHWSEEGLFTKILTFKTNHFGESPIKPWLTQKQKMIFVEVFPNKKHQS